MRIAALGQNPTHRDHNHHVLLGRMGGHQTGNSGCPRNPLWSDKSSQGRAAVTESLPATGCFCLSDICSSGVVLRSNRHKMMFPKGSTITATASLCSIFSPAMRWASIIVWQHYFVINLEVSFVSILVSIQYLPAAIRGLAWNWDRSAAIVLQFLHVCFAGLRDTHCLYPEHRYCLQQRTSASFAKIK